MINDSTRIKLYHGSGGEATRDLIESVFLPSLGNEILKKAEDGAYVGIEGPAVMTADSFTVKPLFFPGGDIGKLAVAGICNDLAVMGARPVFLTMTFILEEGFLIADLKRILASMRHELEINRAQIVCSDTKVVGAGACDGIYISGSGTGLPFNPYSDSINKNGSDKKYFCSVYNILPGDEIVVSGDVGDHGTVVLMAREQIDMKSSLESDCRSLWPVIEKLLTRMNVRAMRDITRGGLATILNEFAVQSGCQITAVEKDIPVKDAVHGFCEMLGFHPYHLACEGAFVAVVGKGEGEKCRDFLAENGFPGASVIGGFGRRLEGMEAPVLLMSPYGTSRRLEPVRGEMLPRIC